MTAPTKGIHVGNSWDPIHTHDSQIILFEFRKIWGGGVPPQIREPPHRVGRQLTWVACNESCQVRVKPSPSTNTYSASHVSIACQLGVGVDKQLTGS